MYNCINFKVRSKNYRKYFYCKSKRQQVTQSECINCSEFILKKNRPIKKVSSKRKFVSQKTYDKTYEECAGQCQLCYTIKNLQLHHIYYRSERIDLIDDPDNCIMLCDECHKLVHSDKKYWQNKLIEKRKKIKKYCN